MFKINFDPQRGLPDDVFLSVSQLVPLVCVDLLIENDSGKKLLTWRTDQFYGPGWHLPGGILRFKEKICTRAKITIKKELDCGLCDLEGPIDHHEQISSERNLRGHFIAFLYRCRLCDPPREDMQFRDDIRMNGSWQWHSCFPDNMIKQHIVYKKYFTV